MFKKLSRKLFERSIYRGQKWGDSIDHARVSSQAAHPLGVTVPKQPTDVIEKRIKNA